MSSKMTDKLNLPLGDKLLLTKMRIWNYAINKMGLKEPFDFIGIKYGVEDAD